MPNYANGKVYKICSYNSDDVYYGSTCLALCQRLAHHVSRWRLFKKGKPYGSKMTSYLILEQGNYYIELVETVPCASKEELQVREKYWIKNNNCVNYYKNLCRTPEEKAEYGASYRLNNKHKKRETDKQYYTLNKDKMKAHRSENILCDCGKYYMHGKRTRHIETNYHKENVNLVMFSQFLDL